MKRNIFGIFLLSFSILLFVGSGEVSAQKYGQGGGGSTSDAITETATKYTITKDTVEIAGHLVITTIEFTTFSATSGTFQDTDGDTVKIQPGNLYPIWYGDGATRLFSVDSTGIGYFAGSVGINKATPAFPLDIVVSGGAAGLSIERESDNQVGFFMQKTGQDWFMGIDVLDDGSDDFFIYDNTDSDRRLGIDGTGNFIIGSANTPNELTPSLSIRSDADSDGPDVLDIFSISLTANTDPTNSIYDFTSTQSGGYRFDKTITHLAAPVFAAYTRHHDLQIGSATQGPNAPTPTTIGTSRGLGFDADNEAVYVNPEIASEWDGASNFILNIHWHPADGDAVANTEKVKWDAHYRSVAIGEAVDNGTLVTATTTFTGGASETDKETYHTQITIVYTGGNQPLAVGDILYVQIDRDVTGEAGGGGGYSGLAIITLLELEFTATALPLH